jgi:hypothetical protein
MRWFNNLSVGPKFGLIGGLLFLLVLVVAGTGFWSANQLNNSLEGVTTDQVPEILNLSYVLDGFEATRALTYASFLEEDPATIHQLTESIRQQLGAIKERLNDYIESDQPDSEKAIAQKIGQDFKDWTSQTQQLITLAEANTPQARQEARQLLTQYSTQRFADDLTQVLDINQRESDQNRVQATQLFQTVSFIIGIVTLLIVLIGLLALGLLAQSVISLTNQQQALNRELKEAFSKLEDRYQIGQNITR